VSSIEPYRIVDALRDPDWVVAMQEELNNFTRNDVWHLVPRPNQNVVGTKWAFHDKQDEHAVVTRNKQNDYDGGVEVFSWIPNQATPRGHLHLPNEIHIRYTQEVWNEECQTHQDTHGNKWESRPRHGR
jgi:hypothetical protein